MVASLLIERRKHALQNHTRNGSYGRGSFDPPQNVPAGLFGQMNIQQNQIRGGRLMVRPLPLQEGQPRLAVADHTQMVGIGEMREGLLEKVDVDRIIFHQQNFFLLWYKFHASPPSEKKRRGLPARSCFLSIILVEKS